MALQVTARNVNLPDGMRAYIETRVSKLERFLDGITDVHVTLSSERYRQIAELNVHGSGNVHLSATESADDLKTAVQHAVDKLEAQAKKQQARRIDKRRRTARTVGSGTLNVVEPPTVEERAPRILRTERFSIKPLGLEEAVMELSAGDDQFLVFRNADNERINVLFRRNERTYGLIDPDSD